MPTLIRLFIVLIVLAGLGFGAMFALTVFVDPGEKDITLRIPARELVPAGGSPDIIDVNDLPAPVNVAPRPSSEPPASSEPASDTSAADIETIQSPGTE